MIYYLYLVGVGQGCDYTIGCNTKLRRLDSANFENARKEAIRLLDEYYAEIDPCERGCDGFRVETARILEVSCNHDLNLTSMREVRETEHAEIAIAEKEEKDRAKYEELKRKFG